MEVTIFQINGRVYKILNVYSIVEMEDAGSIEICVKGSLTVRTLFKKDLIAQIKIGGQHEYKKG